MPYDIYDTSEALAILARANQQFVPVDNEKKTKATIELLDALAKVVKEARLAIDASERELTITAKNGETAKVTAGEEAWTIRFSGHVSVDEIRIRFNAITNQWEGSDAPRRNAVTVIAERLAMGLFSQSTSVPTDVMRR